MERTYVLNVPLDITSEYEILTKIKDCIKQNKKFSIIAININKIMLYQENAEIAKTIKSFDCFIPDGISVVKACKGLKERITGVDLFQYICKNHEEINAKIFLYGSKEQVVIDTKKNLEDIYPNIEIVGIKNGYVNSDDLLIQEINKSKANIIFVAKGSPMQEQWIRNNKDKLNVNVFMGVGGAFDVISGNLKRAPNWIRKIGLEWLYRIFKEPKKRLKQIPILIKYWYLINKERRKVKWEK